MTLHTSTYKGKRILIILKDGRKIIDKFKDKKSGMIITENHGKIKTDTIKAMTIYKGGPTPSDDAPNEPETQLKAIIFDLDNTLLDRPTSLHYFLLDQHQRFLSALGHISAYEYRNRFIALDQNGMVWKDKVYQALTQEFSITQTTWETLLEDYIHEFQRSAKLFDGVLDTLTVLKTQGYTLGIITNGRYPFQHFNIQATGLTPYFSTILISEKEGLKKPDPQLFKRAAKNLNISPTQALYIGDHPETDIQAAQSVGMKAIWKKNTGSTQTCPWADGEFSGFNELLGVIKNIIVKNKINNKTNNHILSRRRNVQNTIPR